METGTDIERSAAIALLDRGVAFRIPAPWWLRLFGKKRVSITVKRLYLGTLVHLSALEQLAPPEPMDVGGDRAEIIAEMDARPMTLPYKVIAENCKAVSRQVAACLLNSSLKIKLFSGILGRHLCRTLNADQLQELVMWLFVYGRAESFTNTTKFIEKMKLTSSRT